MTSALENIGLGVVATFVAGGLAWIGKWALQRLRAAWRKRKHTLRRETATALWMAANAAPVRVGDVVSHHDPVWHGPEVSWQKPDSMARSAALNLLIQALEKHSTNAGALRWTTVADAAWSLRAACEVVSEAWGQKRENTDADTVAVTALAGGLKRELSRPRYRFFIRPEASAPVEPAWRWDE